MSKPDHTRILKFLSKPRFVDEVADHYGIPKKVAFFHLQRAFKSAQVLVSEKPVFQTIKGSNGKPKRIKGFLYVSRVSPIFADGWTKWRVKEADTSVQESKYSNVSVRFISTAYGSFGKEGVAIKQSGIVFEAPGNSRASVTHLKTDGRFTSQFDLSSPKGKLVRRKTPDQFVVRGKMHHQAQLLSYAEKTRLFQALLKKPLSYLELHTRFGVSKQTIKRLVSNGLLKEVWGSNAIGLSFQLTSKGKRHVKESEAEAIYEPKNRERSFIRLKSRAQL